LQIPVPRRSFQTFLTYVRNTLTLGRTNGNTWADETSVLAAHDAGGIFTNSFLEQLFETGSADHSSVISVEPNQPETVRAAEPIPQSSLLSTTPAE